MPLDALTTPRSILRSRDRKRRSPCWWRHFSDRRRRRSFRQGRRAVTSQGQGRCSPIPCDEVSSASFVDFETTSSPAPKIMLKLITIIFNNNENDDHYCFYVCMSIVDRVMGVSNRKRFDFWLRRLWSSVRGGDIIWPRAVCSSLVLLPKYMHQQKWRKPLKITTSAKEVFRSNSNSSTRCTEAQWLSTGRFIWQNSSPTQQYVCLITNFIGGHGGQNF